MRRTKTLISLSVLLALGLATPTIKQRLVQQKASDLAQISSDRSLGGTNYGGSGVSGGLGGAYDQC